jgi:molecular chaperone GrpE
MSGTGHSDASKVKGAPAPGAAAHPAGERSELERLREDAQQAKDRYLRTVAEVENTKKRLQRDKEEFMRYAAETVIRDLLPIVDSLDQALVAVDKQSDPQAVIKGVHLIYRQLLGLLEKEGVRRIATIGEPFDPHKHEAIAEVEVTDGTKDDVVVEEVHVGYTMHGKVIRPAIVKVAKQATRCKPQAAGSEQQTTADEDQNKQ